MALLQPNEKTMVILTNYSYNQMVIENLAGKLYCGGATPVNY
jgi:hypothetical protein